MLEDLSDDSVLLSNSTSIDSAVNTSNSSAIILNSGLGEALFPAGFGFDNVPYGLQQISKTATLFSNLRGYMVSNMRQYLSQAYVEIALIQAVVDIPVDDAMRGGITIRSENLTSEQIKKLQTKIDREDDLGQLAQAAKWNRLFGGAGLVIMTDQDSTEELDVSKIKEDSKLEFKAADLWELFYDKQNIEGFNPAIQDVNFEFYSYYGNKLHKSRVQKLKGLSAPSFIRPRLRGWGFSIVESLVRSINQYIKGTTLIFELLDEAKLDVFHLKNLADTLIQQNGASLVRQRIQLASSQKNFQSAMVLDSEDDYSQKELQFTGVADMLKEIRIQIASDMRMPMTKLFGLQSSGFSDDEGSMENYCAMVESQVRQKIKYDVIQILELRCQQLFGKIPEDLEIEFPSLRIMKSTEEDQVKNGEFNRLMTALQTGAISVEEFRDGCNRANLFRIKLNDSISSLLTTPDSADEEDGNGKPATPGADRSDTQSTKPRE